MAKKKGEVTVRSGPVLSQVLEPHVWVLGPLGWECWGFRALNTDLNITCPWAWFEHEIAMLRKWNHRFFVEWLEPSGG